MNKLLREFDTEDLEYLVKCDKQSSYGQKYSIDIQKQLEIVKKYIKKNPGLENSSNIKVLTLDHKYGKLYL